MASSSSSSLKRENPTTENVDDNAKMHKISSSESQVSAVINPADHDLDFSILHDRITGNALFQSEFAYCWSGARGNIGITTGKYCFGCEFLTNPTVDMKDTPVDQQHVSCVGISRGIAPVSSLGETEHSFGYVGTGKFLNAGEEVEFGESFGEGDTIVCLVDLENESSASLEFLKNGRQLGSRLIKVTKAPVGMPPWASAFFPHVLLKNTQVKFLFSMEHAEYKPWDSAMKDQNAILGPALPKPEDCEVIMMVGVSGSGKTTWVEKRVKENPEKRYIVIGTNLVLDKMKVQASARKFDKDGCFNSVLGKTLYVIHILRLRAANLARNYIIDETNHAKKYRQDKLRPFQSFRKIAVVVFPSQEELLVRVQKRSKEIGKEDFQELDEMLGKFQFPRSKYMRNTEEDFDEVIFTELSRKDAENHLRMMKFYPPFSSRKESEGNHPSNPRDSSVYPVGMSRHPYSNNANIRHPRPQQPGANWSMQPFSNNMNYFPGSSSYSGPQDTRSTYPPPYVPQHRAPYPMPQTSSTYRRGPHRGTRPYFPPR